MSATASLTASISSCFFGPIGQRLSAPLVRTISGSIETTIAGSVVASTTPLRSEMVPRSAGRSRVEAIFLAASAA